MSKTSINTIKSTHLKQSKRLQKINQMVTLQYSHIWDCCCDHGLLGFSLLSRDTTTRVRNTIHFVDIVPALMVELETKLTRFYTNLPWKTHCIDVEKLPLEQYTGKNLIIIAGVGGDLMIRFIEAIYNKNKNLSNSLPIDFLLCPVHHQYPLRQKLIELNFSLKDETLIEDNNRFYEILLVSSTHEDDTKINPVGDKIWQSNSNEQAIIAGKYLSKTINHYQRMQQGFQQRNNKISTQSTLNQSKKNTKSNDVQHIIEAYQAITL